MIADKFVVLDLDRTLLNTDVYSELLVDTVIESDSIKRQIYSVLRESAGNTFDLLSFLLNKVDLTYEQISDRLQKQSLTDALLMPGARDFLNFLSASQHPYGILTTGSIDGQNLKLGTLYRLIGFSIPAEITDVSDKSKELVDQWWSQDGFIIPATLSGGRGDLKAKTLVLVDDKKTNLTTKHPNLVTFHLSDSTIKGGRGFNSIKKYLANDN